MIRQISLICFRAEMKKMADYFSYLYDWKCWEPDQLNPHLNTFGKESDPLIHSYHSYTRPLSNLGPAVNELNRPNILKGLPGAPTLAVVLASTLEASNEALSFNMAIPQGGFAGPTFAKDRQIQVLYVRIPEIHRDLDDPFCEDLGLGPDQIQLIIKSHMKCMVPNWTSSTPLLVPGSIVQVNIIDNPAGLPARATVEKVISEATNMPSKLVRGAQNAFSSDTSYDNYSGYYGAKATGSNPGYDETRELDPTGITIHYTVTYDSPFTQKILAGRELTYHYIISKDGRVEELVSPSIRARHDPATNKSHIGIAFVNLGYDTGSAGRKGAPPKSEWLNMVGSKGYDTWEPYTDAQLYAGERLVENLIARYPKINKIEGHSETSAVKHDPGPAFPLDIFRKILDKNYQPNFRA